MGKETKIGLAVIGVLATIFFSVLYHKLTSGDEPLVDAAEQQSASDSKAAADADSPQPTGKSKLIPGDADSPLRTPSRNWAQADTSDRDTARDADAGTDERYAATASEESTADDAASQTIDVAAARLGSDPFAARSAAPASEAATEAVTTDLDEESAAQVSVTAVDTATESVLPVTEVAEEGDPVPARPFATRPLQAARDPRADRAGQPTHTGARESSSRVEQVSDEEPTSARQPFRARAAQAAADDRYGRGVDADEAEQEIPVRRPGESHARSSRVQSDIATEIESEGDEQASRPERLGRGKADRPKPARVKVDNGKYKVQPNDNYWTISEKVYGSGNYFKAIHEHNRVQHPESDSLSVGDVIEILPEAELLRRYPGLCPKPRAAAPAKSMAVQASAQQRAGGRIYVVEQGDTLFDIARHELGKASRWAEIYDLNRDALGEDFDFLQPGTELTLPSNGRETDAITRQPDDRYRR